MKNLTAQFRRELKKTKERKSGSCLEDSYQSQWYAFQSMLFLADKHTPHMTYDAGRKVKNILYYVITYICPIFITSYLYQKMNVIICAQC